MGGVSMEWKEVTLGEIAIFKTGKLNSNAAISNGEYPFFTCSPETLRINSYAFDQEAILLAGNNAEGNFSIKYYKGKFNAYQRTYVITPIRGKVDIKFLYYALSLCLKQLKNMSQGTSTKFLTVTILNSFSVKLPSISDQRRIASILSSLDRKIELNNKINADLEEMAQAIFKNWFVDFEPFKDGKFVDSELGMIPEGWKVGSLGDFCNVFTGKKNTNQAIEKGLYPFFTCAPEPLASNDAIFNGKAIIIAGNGSYTGRTLFYNGGFDLYQRTYACSIREQDKENLMIFFYHMMKQFFEPTKMGGTRGSSIPYIVMGDITQQKFPYSKDWLIRFSNIANSMMDRKLRIDKENSRLSLLRDTLLPRLMSGELEVPE